MYSQNNEEGVILDYFSEVEDGNILSIGENDGVTLSNTRALIEAGWEADLVEPAPSVFVKLEELYKDSPRVRCFDVAIADINNDEVIFNESGTLLKTGDTALVSTLVQEEMKRWKGGVQFNQVKVRAVTMKTLLLEITKREKYTFINIDAEGYDLQIARQLVTFDFCDASLVCIEWNGNKIDLFNFCFDGWKLIHKNAENLIYAR